MPTVRIPLFGGIESRDYKSFFDGVTAAGAIQYDQGGTDVQFDVLTDNVNGKKIGYFYPRESYATSGVPASTGAGTAVHVWTGNANSIVSAFGATNSTIYNAAASLGAITGQASFISEGVVSDVQQLMITSTGNKGYFYPLAGALTEITATWYPPKQTPALTITGPMVQFDGYTFQMATNGQIWCSDLNAINTGTQASARYVTAQQKPDAGIGVARYQNAIVAFSTSSTEFFFNAGNVSNSPLSPEANFINLGCANQYAFCNIGDTVAFFSTSAGYGIYILEGRQAKKISTPPIDRILAGSTAANVRLNTISSQGRVFLLVTAPVAPCQLAYDMQGGSWQVWNFSGNAVTQSDVVPNSASVSSVYVGPTVASYYTTSATGQSGTFLTGKFDAGNADRKRLNRVSVIAAMGSNAAQNVTISYTDDDYQTFSATRTIDVNASERPLLTRWGTFVTRAFKVSSANDNSGRIVRLAALELDYEQMRS